MGICLALNKKEDYKKPLPPILLIGIAGTGKSTFCKQMQIIHQKHFDNDVYKSILLSNLIVGLQERLVTAEKNEIDPLEENRKTARYITEMNAWEVQWDDKIISAVKKLWADEMISKLNSLPDLNFQITEIDYIMSNMDHYLSPTYELTANDILRARQRTTGSNVVEIESEKHKWQFIDLGGQFSEREKWADVLGNVENLENVKHKSPSSFIAFLSIDEFDVKSKEEPDRTKFTFSLDVICKFASHPEAKSLCPIIFLNKIDLLKKKLSNDAGFESFKAQFPDYTGESTVEASVQYLSQVIVDRLRTDCDITDIQIHQTCALDGELMNAVFGEIRKFFFNKLMNHYGVL